MIEFANQNYETVNVLKSTYDRANNAKVKRQEKGRWIVMAEGSTRHYDVVYHNGYHCNCPHFQKAHKMCKHIVAVLKTAPKLNINIIKG